MSNPHIQDKSIDSIDLFPFYKAFFSDDGTWETLTDKAKMKHKFMLFRLLSIKHAEQISCLNNINSVHVVNSLHNDFKSKGRQPSWAYTKSVKEVTTEKQKLSTYPVELVNAFIKSHDIERKSFDFLLEYDSKSIFDELDHELKIYNQTIKKSKK